MRRVLYVITLVAAFMPAAVTHADPNDLSAAGLTCGVSTIEDPTSQVITFNPPTAQFGEVDGGPVVVAGLPGIDDSTTPPTVDPGPLADNPAAAKLICEIQVNGTGHFSDPDVVYVESAKGTAVAYLPPTLIAYVIFRGDVVWSCTTWRLYDAAGASVDLYSDSVTGEFSTDPTMATCDPVTVATVSLQAACDPAGFENCDVTTVTHKTATFATVARR